MRILDDLSEKPIGSYTTSLQSKMNKRYIIPVKPFSLLPPSCDRPVPTPTWRQFIVGKVKTLSPREEAYRRMLFWYRESLLGGLETRGRIVGRWCTV